MIYSIIQILTKLYTSEPYFKEMIFRNTSTFAFPCSSVNSRSHHYAQLGNALQKHFFAYSALMMGTLTDLP